MSIVRSVFAISLLSLALPALAEEEPTDAPACACSGAQAPAPDEEKAGGGGTAGDDRKRPWSPMMDTRLSFVFADDNVFAAPGTRSEPSPGPQFRASDQNQLFFESYNTRDTGYESLTHLVLYAEMPTHFERLTGEAALVLRLDLDPNTRGGAVRLRDSSSYVRLSYRPPTWLRGEEIAFTGFPVTSDRFRLGYSYRLTWAGDAMFPQAGASVPGARVEVNRNRWYAFAGAKSTQLSEQVETRAETASEVVANYGFLSGFGFDVGPHLKIEFGGAYFSKGTFATGDLVGERIHAGGGSTQVSYRVGREVGTSLDLRLYRNDPRDDPVFLRTPEYGPGVSYAMASELTWLGQTLEDPTLFASTSLQNARAGDLNVIVQQDYNRYFLDAVYQDLEFILFNVPSFIPFQAFADGTTVEPEIFVTVGYDRYFEHLRLTPGLRVGVQRPAHVVTDRIPLGTATPADLVGTRTVVVRRRGDFDILPADAEVKPILAAMGTLRLDLSDAMVALGQVSFQIDDNRATYVKDASGLNVLQFQEPFGLGFNLMLQARF
jgi:hypothetical protein